MTAKDVMRKCSWDSCAKIIDWREGYQTTAGQMCCTDDHRNKCNERDAELRKKREENSKHE